MGFKAAAANWRSLAPRCAETYSRRDREFIAEKQRNRKQRAALEDLWKLSIQAERDFSEAKALKKFKEEQAARKKAYAEHEAKKAKDFEQVRDSISTRKSDVNERQRQTKIREDREAQQRRAHRLKHQESLNALQKHLQKEDENRIRGMKEAAEAEREKRDAKMQLRENERKRAIEEQKKTQQQMIIGARAELEQITQAQVDEVQESKKNALRMKKEREVRREQEKREMQEIEKKQREQENERLRQMRAEEAEEKKRKNEEIEKSKAARKEYLDAQERLRIKQAKEEKARADELREQMLKDAADEARREAEESARMIAAAQVKAEKEKKARDKARAAEQKSKDDMKKAAEEAEIRLQEATVQQELKNERVMAKKINDTKNALDRKIKWLHKYG